jgi:hypothetical protein
MYAIDTRGSGESGTLDCVLDGIDDTKSDLLHLTRDEGTKVEYDLQGFLWPCEETTMMHGLFTRPIQRMAMNSPVKHW